MTLSIRNCNNLNSFCVGPSRGLSRGELSGRNPGNRSRQFEEKIGTFSRSGMATKEIHTPIADTKTKNGKITPISPASGAGNGSNNDYNATSIKVLGGMEAVRKR